MLKSKLQAPENDKSWDWAINNGYLSKIIGPRGNIDVMYAGAADYAIISLTEYNEYDVKSTLKLVSVNAEFRHWVESGMNGTIKGVRWLVKPTHNGNWNLGCPLDRIAIELMMGEIVDSLGRQVEGTPGSRK